VGPYLEKTHHKKRAGGVAQGSEFKPQYCKKQKKDEIIEVNMQKNKC
jgi:hypothetical protein